MAQPWELNWDGVKVEASAAPKLTKEDRQLLNGMRPEHQASLDAADQYRRAAKAIDRLGTGPTKAAFYDAGIAQEGGGFFDKVGSIFGSIGIDSKNRDDFQTLKALSSSRVLTEQIKQKGPQTESDAARLSLTEISPYKTPQANAAIIGPGLLNARLGAAKLPFYTKWANTYGLNGVDEKGRTVEDGWAERVRSAHERLPANIKAANAKRLAGERAKRAAPGVPDVKKLSDDQLMKIAMGN